MENTNEMKLIFDSRPENEGLARVAVAAFCTQLNPTLEEVADLKERTLWVDVIDEGIGITDVSRAMEPLFTTKPEKDRSGMGFTFMEAFMDDVTVDSQMGKGTIVHMKKTIGR